jgi:hypothetical protein
MIFAILRAIRRTHSDLAVLRVARRRHSAEAMPPPRALMPAKSECARPLRYFVRGSELCPK